MKKVSKSASDFQDRIFLKKLNSTRYADYHYYVFDSISGSPLIFIYLIFYYLNKLS